MSESEHISKWFAPISGDLRVGGRYKIEGNASGEVLRCVVPELFELTWEFSGNLSWVSVSLSSKGTSTTLNLEHAERVGDDATNKHWREFGPGATGVYQFPTVDSVTILHALMVQLHCICSAKIVHATRNLRIPRSGCRCDLWNPAFWPRTRRPSRSAELLVARQQAGKRRNAELSVSN